MDIKEKVEKEKKKLIALKEKRIEIDEKIKKLEEDIEKYNNMINQQKFSEISEVIAAKGLTIDEILKAVQSGDMLSLQERMEQCEVQQEVVEEKEVQVDIMEKKNIIN